MTRLSNIDNITASILQSHDYSRTNRFTVEITPPQILLNSFQNNSGRLIYNAKTASLPGRTFDISEVQYSGGYRHKKAIDTSFSELEIQFYLSEDLIEKELMDAWMSFILDPAYQVSTYPDEYYGSITVFKETKGINNLVDTKTYTYTNAFPIAVNDVVQDFDSVSTVDVLSVQFQYLRWFYG